MVKKKIPKFNQIWCVSYLHQWHMQRHNYFGPHPLGPWGGAKRSNIIKSQSQSQFLRFVNQTLCVFSQMQDVKHIRRYFHSVARSCLRGGTSFFSPNSIRFGVCVTHMNGTCNGTILLVLGPLGGAKRSNIIQSQFQSQLQRFLNLTLCVFSQMKDIKHIRRDFHLITWVMHAPGFGTWVCLGSNI